MLGFRVNFTWSQPHAHFLWQNTSSYCLPLWVSFFCLELKLTWSSRLGIHLLHLSIYKFLSHNMGVWLFGFCKILKKMESTNFLTNSLGCLMQHTSLPMKCPEMSDCPALQCQEMVDAKSEPALFSHSFLLHSKGKVPESRSKWWCEQRCRGWGRVLNEYISREGWL